MWFPINVIYPWFKKTSIINYLKSLVYEENLEEYSYLLMEKAKTSLEVLSCKLDDKSFFYGGSPTTLDVIVFAYLAPLLNAPLPSNQFQISLKEYDNLCKLVRRLSTTLFPELKLEYRYVTKLQEEDQEFRSSPGLLMLAILCAASAMITYGMIAGVFRPSRS